MNIRQYLSGCLLCVCGCTTHYTTNNPSQYLESKNGPSVNVPPPMIRDHLSGFYDLTTPTPPLKVSIVPPNRP